MKTFIILLAPDGDYSQGADWYKRQGKDAAEAVEQLMSDLGSGKSETDVALAVEVVNPIQVVGQETRWGVRGTAG